jgi:NIMA (never in mitosis gene a)-related kinase
MKLENVMFDGERVKIVDLGCSNFYGESISRQTMMGTKFYWSPELISREEQNDRLDVWCVGVILFELLFLEQPFGMDNIEKKIRVVVG